MSARSASEKANLIIERKDFPRLFSQLAESGYRIAGPTVRADAIVYEEIASEAELPAGWTDEQSGGAYRLKKGAKEALFGYTVSPQSWKKFLFPSVLRLWRARRQGNGFSVLNEEQEVPRWALLGVRACELKAITIQDKVLIHGSYPDLSYKKRREQIFIIAVNCGRAGETCFCASMNAGPKAEAGFDLALTEILKAGRHYFVVETGSRKGLELMKSVPHQNANVSEMGEAQRVQKETAGQMGRSMVGAKEAKEILCRNYEHPRWAKTADRCLTCANCTMVCPTCFCTTVEDVTDLRGEHAERWRKWDSCFTLNFSYIHGGNIRSSTRSRYRQWLTHKLATWQDQFGTSGCVGCGRCITWCPVGIDLTEEIRAIATEKTNEEKSHAEANP